MFLPARFYWILIAAVAIMAAGAWWAWLFPVGIALLAILAVAVAADFALLWHRKGITAERRCSERFSCGDDNAVGLRIASRYPFATRLTVIDEVPHIFQRRDILFAHALAPHGTATITYRLRPTRRGVYGFGRIRVFAATRLGLLQRRYTCGSPLNVKVFPSYLMLNHYELLAMSNQLTMMGIKRIRRAGNNTEFEQIKDYVQGDDYRAINWKASARRNQLMVNVYTDERSQQIISVIDKGRVMQQAFDGMTLLDYAINATLILSYVAVRKQDRAGLITFNDMLHDFVPPACSQAQMQNLLEALYAQQTDFSESDYSAMLVNVNRLVRKRSLLLLFTNFSGLNSLNRQLPYLRQLNRNHRLLVIFFEDEQLTQFLSERPADTEEYYQHVIGEKVAREKQLIAITLQQQGIQSLLTTPAQLSVDIINRYLEIKARQLF
ncbi:MAG: DUF58 domain-containing protein [Muribaculaceae bacterium]|nr:DUF58 domain-containing protein [Muribaculaceae bacterium]